MKRRLTAILFSGLWITASEFVRNEFLFKSIWINHYNSLGLKFETLPINGILWMVWSFFTAFLISKLLEKFSFMYTSILSWIFAFILMWIVLFNLQVLPLKLLVFAIPLSMLEILVAVLIISKIECKREEKKS